MKPVERLAALFLSRNSRLKGGSTSAPVTIRLFPQFPIWTFVGVHLLKRKESPVYLEFLMELLSYRVQPDRRTVDKGSPIVEVDVELKCVCHGPGFTPSLLARRGTYGI